MRLDPSDQEFSIDGPGGMRMPDCTWRQFRQEIVINEVPDCDYSMTLSMLLGIDMHS
jgi:hypothetical protein